MTVIFRKILFVLIFLLTGCTLFAQTNPSPSGETDMNLYNTIMMIIFFLILNAIFIPLLRNGNPVNQITVLAEKKQTAIGKLKDKLSGLQPIEKESSLMLEGNYDGIQELNNSIPPWFNILFYGTIIIAIIYLLNYHVFNSGKLPLQEYFDEVYAADLKRDELIRTGAFINENTVELLTDNESVKTGKQIFTANCVTCHGDNGQGTVGPNLTDEYWIHGGGIKNVFKTIKYGVPAKGMIVWMNQFNPKMIQQVASYVITLNGTNPPGGKSPEGEKFTVSNSDSLNSKKDSAKSGSANLKPDSAGPGNR